MPWSLIFKFSGPLVIIAGLWWWHSSAVAEVQTKLDNEIKLHAETQAASDELERAVHAAAAERTQAVADAVAESQRQFDSILAYERELRTESDRLTRDAMAESQRAERRLREFRENETNAIWGDTVVPVDWLDWMQHDTGDTAAVPTT